VPRIRRHGARSAQIVASRVRAGLDPFYKLAGASRR